MKKIYVPFIITIVSTLITLSCNSDPSSTHSHADSNKSADTPNMGNPEDTNPIFTITQRQYEASQMTMGTIEKKLFAATLETYGRIHLPERNKGIASSFVGGTVSDMNLIHGQWVSKGQKLFGLTNPDLIDWQQSYLEIQGKLDYLNSEASRLKILAAENITAENNYLRAAADLRMAQTQSGALATKLKLIGIEPTELHNDGLIYSLPMIAPIGGYITEINVVNGSYLPARQSAVAIANTNHLHAEFKVLEREASLLKKDQKINFSIEGNTRKMLTASIYQIENQIDDNRMVNIHGHIESDADTRLIPGMSIRGQIEVGQQEVWALPSEAIIKADTQYFVLQEVSGQPLRYEAIEVQIGERREDYISIINDAALSPTAQYLIKGAYQVYNAPDEAGMGGHGH